MVSTSAVCSCKCHAWGEQKYNHHPFIYDLVGLISMIIFFLIITLSKGPTIVSYMIGSVLKILHSCLAYFIKIAHLIWQRMLVDTTSCIVMETISWNRGDPIRINCYKHRRMCELWIDYTELLSYLYQAIDKAYELDPVLQDSFFGYGNQRSNSYKRTLTVALFNHLDSLPQGYKIFVKCLKKCTENAGCHLGHHSLLELLTSDETELLESAEYKHNLVIREIIRVNLTGFVELMNVNQLIPLMERRELLTADDKDIFTSSNTTPSNKARYLLTNFLNTKGHQGYIKFFECLQEESSHSGHPSIVTDITNSLHEQNICVPEVSIDRGLRIWFKTKGILGTKEYFLAIEQMTFTCLSNDSTKLCQEINSFTETHNTPETKALGTLMGGFRFKLLGQFDDLCDLKSEIESYITSIKDIENNKLINGKWFLLLSCLKRHEGKFKEARALLDKAKADLFFIASGDDLAHVYYTEASLLIEENNCNILQEQQYKQVVALLHNSIKCSPPLSRGISIRQARCHLKLALCHMGSSFNHSHVNQNHTQLEKAKSSLKILQRQFAYLPLRVKMQYYIVRSDYCRGVGNKQQALECVDEGIRLDVDSRFKIDLEYLNHRKR